MIGGESVTFYIPPFWCGVIATVVFEISMIIGAAIVSSIRKKTKRKKSWKMKKITIQDCEYLAERGYYAVIQSEEVVGFVKAGNTDSGND